MEDLSTYLQHSMKESEIVNRVQAMFSTKPEFTCAMEYLYSDSFKRADIMVFYNKEPYACIEVKTNLSYDRAKENGKQQLEYGREKLLLRFGILTNGREAILYDWWKDGAEQEIRNKTLKQTIDYIYNKL